MLFSCPVCMYTSFPDIDSLRTSLVKAANGPLSCPICCDQLLGLDKLIIHLFSHSTTTTTTPMTEDNITKEDESNRGDYQSSVLHQNISKSKKIQKQDELMTLLKPSREQGIIKTHSDHIDKEDCVPKEKAFKCHICSKCFKMNGLLRLHLKVVHSFGISLEIEDAPQVNVLNNSKNLEETIINLGNRCHHKNGIRPNNIKQNELPQQAQPQDEFNLGECENSTTNDDNRAIALETDLLKVHESPKIWKCDVCMKAFTTKYFLKKHKRLHTGEMPYTCGICGRTFTFQQSYHKHLLYHSDQKPHTCGVCGRSFKELSTLHNHHRIHSGEKPFKCEICDKSFRQRVSFLVHSRIHTGVMPYKCDVCGKSFRYKVSQRTHKCVPQEVSERSGPSTLIALFEDSSILDKSSNNCCALKESVNSFDKITLVEKDQETSQELLSKVIDAIVVESCQKLGIKKNQSTPMTQVHSPPSDKLQEFQFAELNTSSFPEFLYN